MKLLLLMVQNLKPEQIHREIDTHTHTHTQPDRLD